MCVLIIKLFASRHQIHLSVFCSVQLGLGPCQSHVSLRVGSLLGFANGGQQKKTARLGKKKSSSSLFFCRSCWRHCSNISSPCQGQLIQQQLAPICRYSPCQNQTHHSQTHQHHPAAPFWRLSPISPSSKPISQTV